MFLILLLFKTNNMNRYLLLVALLFFGFFIEVFSQEYTFSAIENPKPEQVQEVYKANSLTVDILQGGGSLIGVDFELLLTDKIGVQLGFGYIGFGGGINYHLNPSIRSSFISLQYCHQGVGETYTQSLIGPSFVYRARKLFTAQLGLGYLIENGPAWGDRDPIPIMLTYAIGIYLPI